MADHAPENVRLELGQGVLGAEDTGLTFLELRGNVAGCVRERLPDEVVVWQDSGAVLTAAVAGAGKEGVG
jgi:hypothetical protein